MTMLAFRSMATMYAPLTLLLLVNLSSSWVLIPSSRNPIARSIKSSSSLFLADEPSPSGGEITSGISNFEEIGTRLILEAAAQVGAVEGQLDIEWKGGKILVVVHGDNTYVSDAKRDDDSEEGSEEEDSEEVEDVPAPARVEGAVDVTELARAINAILDDDGIGLRIAEVHEIEVTTPGASDELSGVMFESYKGFDVIAQFIDKKTKNTKTVEGKFVEKGDEFTIINIKGRMKKIKNEDVLSLKLPKAKKEKGAR
jgi:hypothetical protein